MQKGQKVKCVESYDTAVTEGNIYPVHAGYKDPDTVCGGRVLSDGFITTSDEGDEIYCMYPACLFGKWELVQE
ncbi:MAG: hypothetical protein ACRDDY_17765 [Clostridium sp.]|uniref:hypothetical protein n=1 Tax=Clostridium sp. TaxID=1506 RepID=UPI003EE5515D